MNSIKLFIFCGALCVHTKYLAGCSLASMIELIVTDWMKNSFYFESKPISFAMITIECCSTPTAGEKHSIHNSESETLHWMLRFTGAYGTFYLAHSNHKILSRRGMTEHSACVTPNTYAWEFRVNVHIYTNIQFWTHQRNHAKNFN